MDLACFDSHFSWKMNDLSWLFSLVAMVPLDHLPCSQRTTTTEMVVRLGQHLKKKKDSAHFGQLRYLSHSKWSISIHFGRRPALWRRRTPRPQRPGTTSWWFGLPGGCWRWLLGELLFAASTLLRQPLQNLKTKGFKGGCLTKQTSTCTKVSSLKMQMLLTIKLF